MTNTYKLPEIAILKLNYMEFGYLYGAIPKDVWDKMPRPLWLKLNIISTKAYFSHSAFGPQAKKDVARWEKELKSIKRKENV